MVEVTPPRRLTARPVERDNRALRNYQSKVAMLRQALADLPLDIALEQVERYLRILSNDGALGPADAKVIERCGNNVGRIAHDVGRS